MSSSVFQFKKFEVEQANAQMKIGTDGILLGAWADVSNSVNALDIGAGNGLISMMIAQRNTSISVDAVEIELNSYQQAVENFSKCPWLGRVHAHHSSIQDWAEQNHRYDLIVSNPPFFTGGTFSYNQDKNSVRHTVKLPMGELLLSAKKLLKPTGKLCVILPLIEGLQFIDRAKFMSLYCTKLVRVRSLADKSVNRLLIEVQATEQALIEEEFVIANSTKPNDYTPAFIEITKDFYNWMP